MRKKIDLILLAAVLFAGFFAVRNAQSIGDWWFLRTYSPSQEVAGLAKDTGMTEAGKRLFYRFSPDFYNKKEISEHCSGEKLGCIEGQDIYLLDYSSQAEYNRTAVTAAHEMLHVVYDRLTEKEKSEINLLLDNELAKPEAAEVVEKLSGYSRADYYDEAHSFIGTELAEVSNELESHYGLYFEDRAAIYDLYLKSAE